MSHKKREKDTEENEEDEKKESKGEAQKEDIAWKLIDKYFKDNPYNLVAHHLDSYNDFFTTGIYNIFKENNPIRFIEREDKDDPDNEKRDECSVYLGGKNGDKIYFGKPIIYDNVSYSAKSAHYMYPNDARLRNMTYGITVHYDVDIVIVSYTDDGTKKEETVTLEKKYLGRFPIMLQSNLCILKNMSPEVRFNMGECRNDFGGYFIIDGKEKSIIPQEKFANNMLYIREIKDDLSSYSHSAEIRSVSEDASKPIRTTSIKIVAPSTTLSNNQILVDVPNVRKPIPLFILMRALGVVSDKSIIEYCLLDLEKNRDYVDLFIPSIHDANMIFNQETALEYIKTFTKRRTVTEVLDILINYFLPHIGEKNLLDKAYFVGYMVARLLRVFTKEDKPTDRDNFRFKRIELAGTLMYDLFREYHLLFKRQIGLFIDSKYYYRRGYYKNQLNRLITDNMYDLFEDPQKRIIEVGFRRAFKGNWGSEEHTKRVGVVQDLNRLSWNSFMSQLRKMNLPLDASAKVVGPRLLNSSQWGYIDPVDTPDGGNIGLHKHISLSTSITSGYSCWPLIKWIRAKTRLRILQECNPPLLSNMTKVFVNGNWIGGIERPLEFVKMIKLFRRNGLFPVYTSISFDYENNEIMMYTDAGRLTRPIFYLEDQDSDSRSHKSIKKISYQRKDILEKIDSGKFTWQEIVSGFKEKAETAEYSYRNNTIYGVQELYPDLISPEHVERDMEKYKSIFDYVDTSEEEGLMIANHMDDLKKNHYYTHMEWKSSLILGVMGNQIIFPENNQFPRNVFSCGQSRQAVSVYHSNYQMRMDKMGVVLNNGQIPLVKSRYMEYINKEEQPYGVNAIVAIMSYTGYNVEDAILINEGAVKRGLFNTTYFTTYESREENEKTNDSVIKSVFADVMKKNVVGLKKDYDYSQLDESGLVKEGTAIDDKIVIIGQVTSSSDNDTGKVKDSSTFTKKGQLGFVDKSFITEGEEGSRIAKVRVREERLPSIGDKMASRAGQKGTIGLIIPECNMPFTEDGLKPDLIINPHALPSRMTIGQLIESVLGKICTHYGGFGNCTAFETKGSNTEVYGEALVNAGYHSSGNQILYNGMTGDQIYSEIYIGPTYYMRLKHMVKDKINYRARGPNTMLERQPVQGRANDGGLRIGEMERDGVMAHGASAFLNDSLMVRADEYYMAVCNKTGCAAIYNPSLNLFLSPFADGPIHFSEAINGSDKQNIENISRFGRSFSIVRVPYALKLLIQELQVMNIQMRIITEENIDQLVSMSYSDNMYKLLNVKKEDGLTEDKNLSLWLKRYTDQITKKVNTDKKRKNDINVKEIHQGFETTPATPESQGEFIPYAPDSPPGVNDNDNNNNNNENSPPDNPYGLQYASPLPTPPYDGSSPQYDPRAPQYNDPNSPPDDPNVWKMGNQIPTVTRQGTIHIENPALKAQFDALPEIDKRLLLKMIEKEKEKKNERIETEIGKVLDPQNSILEVEEEKKEDTDENKDNGGEEGDNKDSSSSQSGGETKKISFKLDTL